MKYFIAKLATYLYLRLHLYRFFSLLHRRLFDRRPEGLKLPTVKTFRELSEMIVQMKWRPDGFKDFGDAFCTPEEIYLCYLTDPTKQVGDCDEFAVFISNVLNRSWTQFEEGAVNASIMTVTWQAADGKLGGHNVARLTRSYTNTNRYGYMDYHMPEWFATPQDVVDSIVAKYGGKGARLMVWGVTHYHTLKPLEVHWG